MTTSSEQLTFLSQWVDDGNAARDPEALMWHRVCKVSEEAGEAVAAMIGYTGGNPRKGVSHSLKDVEEECLDTAISALGAVEHLHGNDGLALHRLFGKLERVYLRAQEADNRPAGSI